MFALTLGVRFVQVVSVGTQHLIQRHLEAFRQGGIVDERRVTLAREFGIESVEHLDDQLEMVVHQEVVKPVDRSSQCGGVRRLQTEVLVRVSDHVQNGIEQNRGGPSGRERCGISAGRIVLLQDSCLEAADRRRRKRVGDRRSVATLCCGWLVYQDGFPRSGVVHARASRGKRTPVPDHQISNDGRIQRRRQAQGTCRTFGRVRESPAQEDG